MQPSKHSSDSNLEQAQAQAQAAAPWASRPSAKAAMGLAGLFVAVCAFYFFTHRQGTTPAIISTAPTKIENWPASLQEPKNHSLFWPREADGIKFVWQLTAPKKLSLQIALDKNFEKIAEQIDDVESAIVVHGLKREQTYYWRLIESNSANATIRLSEAHDFFIGDLNSPVLMGPPSGTKTIIQKALVSWHARPFVETYRLQISTDKEFSDVVRDLSVGANRYQMSELPSGKYFWRVSVRDRKPLRNIWSSSRAIVISDDNRLPADE